MLFEQPFEPELDGQQAVALGADRQWTVVGATVLGQRPLIAFQDWTGDLGRSGEFPLPTPVAKPPQAVMSEFDGGWGKVAVGQGMEKGITQGGNRGWTGAVTGHGTSRLDVGVVHRSPPVSTALACPLWI